MRQGRIPKDTRSGVFFALVSRSLIVAFAIINSAIFALKFARYTPLKTDVKTRVFGVKNSLQLLRKSPETTCATLRFTPTQAKFLTIVYHMFLIA